MRLMTRVISSMCEGNRRTAAGEQENNIGVHGSTEIAVARDEEGERGAGPRVLGHLQCAAGPEAHARRRVRQHRRDERRVVVRVAH